MRYACPIGLRAPPADRFRPRPCRRPRRVRQRRGERLGELDERLARIGDDAERDRIAPPDLPRVVVHLHDAELAPERRPLGVEEPGEDVRADDQDAVALAERLAHGGRRREQPAPPEWMITREVGAAVHGLAVDPRAEELGEGHQGGEGARAGDSVPRDHERRAGSCQQLGRARDRGRLGA